MKDLAPAAYKESNRDRVRLGHPLTHGLTSDLDAKSLPTQADQKEQRLTPAEILRQQAGQLQAEAFRLQLQSTVMGAKPKAVIDGALVGEGDVVAQFRVLKIEARRIIVEREGIKLEIQMK